MIFGMGVLFRFLIFLIFFLFLSREVFGMHIVEGFLPVGWSIFWIIVSFPFVLWAFLHIRKRLVDMQMKMLFIFVSAFVLLLSSLKLPSIMGSSSHPTGIALGVMLFGPFVMGGTAFLVLLMQALLMAHGGLSTLGANVFSMGVMAPFIAYFLYSFLERWKLTPFRFNVFVLAFLCNLFTYVVVSLQLSFAFPGSSYILSFLEFLSIFSFVQFPIAVIEGLLTVFVVDLLMRYRSGDIIYIRSSFRVRGHSALKSVFVICLALFLMFLPLLFGGSSLPDLDELSLFYIHERAPGYRQWFDYLFEIPSSYEPFIFAIVGIIAFSFIVYYLFRGFVSGKRGVVDKGEANKGEVNKGEVNKGVIKKGR